MGLLVAVMFIASKAVLKLSCSRAVILLCFSKLLVVYEIYLMLRSEILQSREIDFMLLIGDIRSVHVLTLPNGEHC